MGLQFAAPWMLLGLLLGVLPVVAHLTGFREVRTIPFPTLRFLRASQIKVRKRTRLQSWLLLLLRLLAVAAAVTAFSGLELTWSAPAPAGLDPNRTTLVLLDTSASMSGPRPGPGGTLFEGARDEARRILSGLSEGTQAALLRFDGVPATAGPGLTADHAELLAALDSLRAGAAATDLDRALRSARDLLRDGGFLSANVFVLSDGTATSLPSPQGRDWPEGIRVHYFDLASAARRGNRWVDRVELRSAADRGAGVALDASLRSVGISGERPLPLTLDLGEGVEVVGDVDFAGSASARRRFAIPLPPEGAVSATLRLPGDALPLDDSFPFTLVGDTSLDVLLVSGDGGSNPRNDEVWYLQKALQPGAGSTSRVSPRVVAAEELRHVDGGRGDVVFLCNVADPAPLVPELLTFVRKGGGLFLSLGNRVDPEPWSDALADLLPARLTELKTRGSGTFEQSPIGLSAPPTERDEFRVFRTGGAAVFSSVRFGKVMGTEPRLAEGAKVLLRYTDGLPALLERQVGAGTVLLLTSSVDDDWTDLPLRSVFVPLVHQFARSLSQTLALDGGDVLDSGASIALPLPPDASSPAWVRRPDGREIALDPGAADAEGRVRFADSAQAGHYLLYWGVGGDRSRGVERARFSVRVPAAESELRELSRTELQAAIPGLVWHRADGGESDGAEPGRVRKTSSLSPVALGMLGLVLLGEVTLAGRRA